jgi:hypothetical protein
LKYESSFFGVSGCPRGTPAARKPNRPGSSAVKATPTILATRPSLQCGALVALVDHALGQLGRHKPLRWTFRGPANEATQGRLHGPSTASHVPLRGDPCG